MKTYFGLYFVLTFLQFLTLLLVKMFTGHEFYNRSNIFQKINHIFENLNYASPYIDWDVAPSTRKGFKDRYRYCQARVQVKSQSQVLAQISMLKSTSGAYVQGQALS